MTEPRDFELITPENKGILGHLDKNGVVTFAIVAGPGSSMRGTEMFNRMMDAFGDDVITPAEKLVNTSPERERRGRGRNGCIPSLALRAGEVLLCRRNKAIQGVWVKGPRGEPSINIDKVNELSAQGMELEEAVLHAWTVTRAQKRGFRTVLVQQTHGVPGAFLRVEVLILKS